MNALLGPKGLFALVLLALALGAYGVLRPVPAAVEADPGSSAADRETARQITALQAEVQSLRDALDGLRDEIGQAQPSPGAPPVRAARVAGRVPARSGSPVDPAQADVIAQQVARTVEGRLQDRIDRLTARQQQRNAFGQWKAPMDELARELGLSDTEHEAAIAIFNGGRDASYELLTLEQADGTTMLDALVDSIQGGTVDAWFRNLSQVKVPGSDETYSARYAALIRDLRADLAEQLTDEQMQRLDGLNLALLEIQTGYDPVADEIGARLSP